MSRYSGQLLLVALLLSLYSVNISRALFEQDGGPAFLSEQDGFVSVELGHGFSEPSIHQFIDGDTMSSVMELTDVPVVTHLGGVVRIEEPLQAGQKVDLIVKNNHIEGVTVSWMPAAKRMSLGIALHPDRMNEADWRVLPGVGEKMARRIVENRQKYGDFGTFENLKRVKGVGAKRLSSWNQYFFSESSIP